MKILFYIDCLASGGKERRFVELIKALCKNKEINFAIILMNKDIHYGEILHLGIDIHYLIRKSKKDISVFAQLYKFVKKYQPDIVHCWDSMTAVYGAPICKILDIPFINGMVIDAPTKKLFNKHFLRSKIVFPLSDYIVGNSYAGIKAYGAAKNKSIVIQNGFNFNRIISLQDGETIKEKYNIQTDLVVGMVASYSKYKDYKTYFDAAQKILVKRSDITFLALGNDTDSEEAKSLIKTEYLNNFRLLGKKANIESLINIMDVCVLATFTEGISNSILEYMALAKPVIATDGGGTNEIIEDNINGFLIKVADFNDLSDKIQILLDDKPMRLRMGKQALRTIQDKFSIEKMLNSYVELYKSVVEKNLELKLKT